MQTKSKCDFFKSSLKKLFLVTLCSILFSSALHADDMGNSWSIVATRDLQFARKTLLDSHPAVLLEDKEFHAWMTIGYDESLKLARQVRNKDQATASVVYFLNGFKDGHLGGAPIADSDGVYWAGWTVRESDGLFYVWEVADVWDAELPPLGAVLNTCDGAPVNELVEKIAPFIDRRADLPGTLIKVSAFISNRLWVYPMWEPLRFKECTFQMPTGELRSYAVTWKKTEEGWERAFKKPSAARFSMEEIEPGAYWVYLSSFNLDGKDLEAYADLLEKIRHLSLAKTIIFDVRGNGGGSSSYGERILSALLKNRIPPDNSEAKATWRVSDLSVKTVSEFALHFKESEGSDGAFYKGLNSFSERMKEAHSMGEKWVEQPNYDVLLEEEKGVPFSGDVVVLTNEFCSSACLDFVDRVLQIPHAIHLGRTTGADTNYLEVTSLKLPSGAVMWLPLKVWRNRSRKSNQPHIPVQRFPGDMRDTAALQQWTLKSVAEILSQKK